jgi:RimJ/RimL family protein N-acetyltransferase
VRIPTLQTERLTLRAPGPQDFEPFAAFYASERASMVGGPEDRMSSWRRFAAVIGHWHLRGYGFWTVEEAGTVRGLVGLWYPEGWPEPEIGWMLFDGAEGRGVAHEAALAARAHAYGALGWTTAISTIRPENARSIALAGRMGAVRDGDFDHPKVGTVGIWRHPGPDA